MKKTRNEAIEEVKAVQSEEISARNWEPKKSLVGKYKGMFIVMIIYLIFTMPICIYIAYNNCIEQFGDGPANYTDDAYNLMRLALVGGTLRSDTVENILGQEKAEKIFEGFFKENSEENLGENAEEVKEIYVDPCLIENIGLDIKRFGLFVTDFELHTKDGDIILTSWIRKGSFTAEIVTTLNEDYKVVADPRNYENKEQFMAEFYQNLRDSFMSHGLALWGMIALLPFILLVIIIKIVDKFSERSMRKKEEKAEADARKQDDIDSKDDAKAKDASVKEIKLVPGETSEISA